jgi:hypothetical protein
MVLFHIYRFSFSNGESLCVTPEHPLYRGKGAFFIADYARLNQKYKSLDSWKNEILDTTLVGMSIENDEALAPVKTYNLYVPEHHTYIAGGILVHNTKPVFNDY